MTINPSSLDCLTATLRIDNKGYSTFIADKIRADYPPGLRISFKQHGEYDTKTGTVGQPEPTWSDALDWTITVAPGKTSSEVFFLSVPEGRRAETRLSISVQVSIRRWVMPYKTQLVTAMVMDNRSKQKD